jgi:hypothetical protein
MDRRIEHAVANGLCVFLYTVEREAINVGVIWWCLFDHDVFIIR